MMVQQLLVTAAVSLRVVSLVVWSLMAFLVLQLYAALALLTGTSHRSARWLLAALFVLNAAIAGLEVVRRVTDVDLALAITALDSPTNGLLVLGVEAAAVALTGRHNTTARWSAVGAFAAATVLIPLAALAAGIALTAATTLAAYAFAGARLVSAWQRLDRGSVQSVWAAWLVVAFMPRIAEFSVGFASRGAVLDTPLGEGVVTAASLLVMFLASAYAMHYARVSRSMLFTGVMSGVAGGLLVGIARNPLVVPPGFVHEPIIIFLTLGAVRPLGVLAGISASGLLGASLPWSSMRTHAFLVVGTTSAFGLALLVLPIFVENAWNPTWFLVAGASALVTLPLFHWLARRRPAGELPRRAGSRRNDLAGGRYERLHVLGTGTYGQTNLCRDRATGDLVAVKELMPYWLGNDEVVARFRKEVETLRGLDHPNVTRLRDSVLGPEEYLLVMDYAEGGSLEQRLASGPLPKEQALAVAMDVLAGLEAAHRRNIVHRDIKPANVLLRDDGAQLADFGVAHGNGSQGTLAGLTTPGHSLGTLLYMAPEQVAGRKAGVPSDIYAVGALLHALLTGKHYVSPQPENEWELREAILRKEPSLEGIDIGLRSILARALAKEPSVRYPSAAAMANALRVASQGTPFSPRGTGAGSSRPR